MRIAFTAPARARVAGIATPVAAVAAAGAWWDFAARVIAPAFRLDQWPASAYWVAPRLALEGRLDVVYDPAALAASARAMGAVQDVFTHNPPTSLLPLLPFGLLPQSAALDLWLALSLVAIAAAWGLLLAALRLPLPVAIAATALVPVFEPLRANLAWGQAYLFVLLALVAGGLLSIRGPRSAVAAGIAFGLMGGLKAWYGIALLLPHVARWRTRVVGAAVGVGAVLVLVTVVAWGVEPWRTWLPDAVAFRGRPETSVTAYQTINGLAGHLFRFDARWNPGPVVHLPWLVDALWLGAAIALAGTTALLARRAAGTSSAEPGQPPDAAEALLHVALSVPVAILLSPVAEDHHFVLMLLPLAVAAAVLARPRLSPAVTVRAAGWSILGLATALLALPLPFEAPDGSGWSALLHYPRVFGGLLLWALLGALLATAASGRGRAAGSPGAGG